MPRSLALATVLVGLVVGCGTPAVSQIVFEGGDGLTCKRPIEIRGAKTTLAGVEAQRQWLKEHYLGFTKRGQRLLGTTDGDLYFDLITIVTQDGRELEICFDITDYWNAPFE